MAGAPQQPRFQLPGAEYLNLKPDGHIALGARLAQITAGAPISVPANSASQANVDITLQTQFTYGMGIYIVRAWVLFIPSDVLGEITINAARLGIGSGGGNIAIDIGLPTATFATPRTAQVAIYDRDLFLTQQDFASIGKFAANIPAVLSGGITIVNTDATNPHSYSISTYCIWHQLQGINQ